MHAVQDAGVTFELYNLPVTFILNYESSGTWTVLIKWQSTSDHVYFPLSMTLTAVKSGLSGKKVFMWFVSAKLQETQLQLPHCIKWNGGAS